MVSLRELLESKERRRALVPIQVSDITEDHEAWMALYVAIEAAKTRDDATEIARLQSQLAEAADKLQSHWANVELESLASDEWERATRVWRNTDEDSPDTIDWKNALPVLLSASCTDPELRDPQWWEQQLARPTWAEGDRDALKMALLRLNVSVVEPNLPKG